MQLVAVSIEELEHLLLQMLSSNVGCKGVRHVTVIPREQGDWICGCVQAGEVSPNIWRHHLTKLETLYRSKYRLAHKRRV
jgi:hypothetical protein